MKGKELYKGIRLFMIISLVIQALFPVLSIADTLEKEKNPSRIHLSEASWEDEKKTHLVIDGEILKGNFEEENSETIELEGAEFINIDQQAQLSDITDGHYSLKDNKIFLTLGKESQGKLSLRLQVVKDSLVDGKEIKVTLGDQVLIVPIKIEKSDEASTNAEETSVSEKKTGTLTDKERGLNLGSTQFLPNAQSFPWTIVENSKSSDPNTDGLADMGFSDVPGAHDGRIWTDKTVRHDLGSLSEDQFEVTLSALAQSAPARAGYQIPADTVFTIDVSGSMTRVDSPGGRSRIALLVDAINEAIDILQDANPLNRVAVVAYGGATGGYARVENVLSLGRYDSTNGSFFTMGTSSRVNVVAKPVPNSGGQVKADRLSVTGSTPTQWGIREASRILEQVSDRLVEVPVTDEDGNPEAPVTVTRRPNLILMTDGEPTMGRPDFAFDSSSPVPVGPNGGQIVASTGDFYGDGSYGEQGLAVMTALTAAYRERTVFNHFFPQGQVQGTAPTQPGADVGFFSISLGVQATAAAQNLISATLNPIAANTSLVGPNIRHQMGMSGTTAGPTSATPTMATLFNNFVNNGSTGNFQAQFRQGISNYQWNNAKSTVNITNNAPITLTASNIAYADEFFKADDLQTLRDAFISITNNIQNTSNSNIVDGSGDASDLGAGRVDFSDVLGKYMTFDGLTNIEFPAPSGGTFTYNIADVDAHREEFIKTLTSQIRYPEPSVDFISDTDAAQILDNRPGGMITYYTDTDGRYLGVDASLEATAATKVALYPVWGAVESQATGTSANVSGLLFSVYTALRDITFRSDYGTGKTGERLLQTQDQFVHWSIPQNLLPERTVREDGTITGNTSPVRARFNVSLDEERVEADLRAGGGAMPTSFYSNFWEQENNDSFVTFEPSKANPFFNFDGDRVITKTENTTATDAHVSIQNSTADPTDPAGRIVVNLLGNNGTFALEYKGQIRLEKEFIFLDADGNRVNPDGEIPTGVQLEPLKFEIKTPSGEIRTVDFDPHAFVLENGRYSFNLPEDLPPGTYEVTEIGGDVTTPGYTHVPGQKTQSVSIAPGSTATASFVNLYVAPAPILPSLRIIKFFHGLPNGVYPENFEILVEGPVGVNPQPGSPGVWTENTTSGRWETRLNLNEAISGTAFLDIEQGTYTITELNADNLVNQDYLFSGNSWSYRETGHGGNSGQGSGTGPVDVTIRGAEDDVIFRFDNFYEQLGSFALTKTFEGLPLDRIPENFYIAVTNENNEEVGRISKADILSDDTTLQVEKLPPGLYTITEHNYKVEGWEHISTATIDGTPLAGTGDPLQYNFYISGGGANNNIAINMNNRYNRPPVTPPLPPIYPLQLIKVDQYGHRVAKAQFELQFYDTSANEWKTIVEGLESDKNGLVNYVVTEPGRYRFHETQAPSGYEIAENPYSEERTVVDGNTGLIRFGEMENRLIERIQIRKTDAANKPLAGAVFKVELRNNGSWETIAEGLTSGADGLVTHTVEKDGLYRFIETQAPTGFVLDESPREVKVNAGETGQSTFFAGDMVNHRAGPEKPETPSYALQLLKVNEANDPLSGAVFKLEMYNESTETWEIVSENLSSDSNGRVTANVPKVARYRFIETSAPEGYVLDATPIETTIEEGATGVIDAGKLVNKSRDGLPSTGENLGLWLVALGLLSLLVAGFAVSQKRKRNKR